MEKKTYTLNDGYIDAVIDFQEGEPLLLRDATVKGLQLRIGKRRHTWEFYSERRDHGERRYTCKALGHYDRGFRAGYVSGGRGPSMAGEVYIGPQPALQRLPDHVDVETARNKARAWAVKAIEGTLPVGKREGVKFADAFADYVDYLERKAASKGKAPRWAKNVRQLGAQLLLPKWGTWSLTEMSERPDAVADWHRDAVKLAGPTSANHAARVIRALYKRRAKRDLRLSKVNIPTAAVEMHTERGEQKGMAAKDFPAWFKAWQAIESPVRRAYHMVDLLTGARPGELARCRWQDLSDDALTIGDAKAGNDIVIPLTPAIRGALALAPKGKPEDSIFPGCAQVGHREPGLPASCHALRRTFKTIAQNESGVSEEVSAYLLGHQPEGMSQKYLLKWAMRNGTAIKEGQQKISRTMVRLLHQHRKRMTA